MTQHYLAPKFPEIHSEILVGFDRLLNHFFITVLDPDEEPVIDFGSSFIPVMRQLDKVAHIPDGFATELSSDKFLDYPESNKIKNWTKVV